MFNKNILQKIDTDDLSLFERLKQANNLLDKINQVLKEKLEEINELKSIEETLCNQLEEQPIEFDAESKENPKSIYFFE